MQQQALEGIRVLDFSRILAGPIITRVLADYGATVVNVGSGKETARGLSVADNRIGQLTFGTNKYKMTLNFAHPRHIEVSNKLFEWCDIVVENFRPRVMEKWGWGYEALGQINPDIIVARVSAFGQEGPYSRTPATGITLQAEAGYAHLTGWPDRCPAVGVAISDFCVPWYAVVAILAALEHRDKTGAGMYIDLSQLESAVCFLAPFILDYVANGHIASRIGNRQPYTAPHGVYRSKGDDEWCAISVFTPEEWTSFCQVVGNTEWTKNPKFCTVVERKKNEDELDKLIETWTLGLTPDMVMKKMQAAKVAAGAVQNGRELWNDPQLKHRHHIRMVTHPLKGEYSDEELSFRLSKTPATLRKPTKPKESLEMGDDTGYICTEILQMKKETFSSLVEAGVFT